MVAWGQLDAVGVLGSDGAISAALGTSSEMPAIRSTVGGDDNGKSCWLFAIVGCDEWAIGSAGGVAVLAVTPVSTFTTEASTIDCNAVTSSAFVLPASGTGI